METEIKTIFFDLGDTLVCISHITLAKICKKIGGVRKYPLSIEDYKSAYSNEWKNRSSLSALDAVRRTKANSDESERNYWESFFESLLTSLNISPCQSELTDWLINTYMDPSSFVCFNDVHSILSELRSKGWILGIISNAFPSADRMLDHLELRQYFKYIFLSFELPYAKPETRIYQFAAQKANLPIE